MKNRVTTKEVVINVNQQFYKLVLESLEILGYNDIEDLINHLLHEWIERGR